MKSNLILQPPVLAAAPRRFRSTPSALLKVGVVCSMLVHSLQAGFIPPATNAIPAVYSGAVAWGDYDNDQDLDVVVTGLDAGDIPMCRIFRNQAGTFVNSGVGLPAIFSSAVAWGDYDNDGNLDLLLGGATSLGYPYAPICRLYHNRGDGTFENSGVELPGIYSGAVAWADYDNDGDLDFVISGWSGTVPATRICRIYRNDRGGVFTDSGIDLPGIGYSSVAWGDYDNDGDLDLVLAGSSSSGRITRLYRNEQNGSFSDSGIQFPGVTGGSVAWGDFDNDADLDLLVTGAAVDASTAKIYINQGNSIFTENSSSLAGVSSSAGAWGDYDNDGDLDVLVTGLGQEGPISIIYTNHGTGLFSESGIVLPGAAAGCAAWGDYDNSGQLDLILTGFDDDLEVVTYLGRNNETTSNQPPPAIGGLAVRLTGRDVSLTWAGVSDDHTPAEGLHYNLRLGTASGSGNRVSPLANPINGFRRVVRFGNGARTNTWTVKGLPDGTYYWSVQAIDTAFAGGPFAMESQFTVPSNPPTDIALNPARVKEGQPSGTMVGILTASDLNADDTHVFALVPGPGSIDNGSFDIVGNELRTIATFDFEVQQSCQLRLRATDPGGLSCEKTLTVIIEDVNDPPEAICADAIVTADANGVASAFIDNHSFDPDSGDAIAVSQSPPGPYPYGTNLVTLLVTDAKGGSNSCVATVIVRDNMAPQVSFPSNLVVELPPGQCEVSVDFLAAVIIKDNCDTSPQVTSTPPSGTETLLSVGPTIVSCTVTDASGNATNFNFTVTVIPANEMVGGETWVPRVIPASPPVSLWAAIASSDSGIVIAAPSYGQLHVSTNYGATWVPCQESRDWQCVASSANGERLVAVALNSRICISTDFGATWTERDNTRQWTSVATSSDGMKLVATVWGGRIYTSANGGTNWTEHGEMRGWKSIASSTDGSSLAAAVQDGNIYTSSDFGLTWTPHGPEQEWSALACSAGGDVLVAAARGGKIYTSMDSGETWTPRETERAWSAVACFQYGLMLAVVDGGQVYASTDLGQTWIPSENNRGWSAVALARAGSSVVAFAAVMGGDIYSSWDYGVTWDVSATTRLWGPVASSLDGRTFIAAVAGGQLYTSTNAGASWTARADNRDWCSVASSFDGTRLFAAVSGGQIWNSGDSGLTWAPLETNRNWVGIACSGDGIRVIGAVKNESIYVSTNSGGIWTAKMGNYNWAGVASSADGGKLAGVVYDGFVYISADGGNSWVSRASRDLWRAVASSWDGSVLAAVAEGGQIHISTDFGTNWITRESWRQWSSIASSSDGRKLIAAEYRGQLYISRDYGVSWTPRENNHWWKGVASSADGSLLLASVYGGHIYTSVPQVAPPAPPTILGAIDRVVAADSAGGATLTFEVTATNKCQPQVPVTCTPPSGSLFGFGTNLVTCVAVDVFGISETNTFTVAVVERPEKSGWGQALALNGATDYASAEGIVLSNTPLTIELWARRDSFGTWDAMVAQGANTSGQGLFFTFLSNDRIAFSFSSGDLLTANGYTDSAWHHWAATYHPDVGRRIYRDGVEVAADANLAPYRGSGPLIIGAIPWRTDALFNGSIDDVRIWKEARSQAQIWNSMLHPLTGRSSGTNLLAYWNCNGDGGTLRDATVNNRHATLFGDPGRHGSTVPPWGYALSFDGTNEYVEATIPLLSSNYTVSAWVWLRSGGNSTNRVGVLASTNCGDSAELLVHSITGSYSDPQYLELGRCSAFSGTASTLTVPLNEWVHLAITVSPEKEVRYYINGNAAGSWSAVDQDVAIGPNISLFDNVVRRSDGLLDDLQVWHTALTQAQIQANLGRPLLGTEPGLILYWNFDAGSGLTVFDSSPNLSDGSLAGPPLWVASTISRPPTVTTLLATEVVSSPSTSTATLNGLTTPNMAPTIAWFDWGTSTNYGLQTPPSNLGSGLDSIPCSALLTNLTAGLTYHYRLSAQNGFGVTHGADQTVSPILITMNGNNPLTNQARAAFYDPGCVVQNGLVMNTHAIAAGYLHSLILNNDGTIIGLGYSPTAKPPPGLSEVTKIAACYTHSLALKADGSVINWGETEGPVIPPPAGLNGVAAIAAGYFHDLALKTNGTVVGWGHPAYTTYGQAAPPAGLTNVMVCSI